MTKIYTLSAVSADGQDTSIGILVDDDEKLREWLCDVRRHVVVENFKFRWAVTPRSIAFPLLGAFAALYTREGLYIEARLFYEDYYRDALYPIGALWRMLFKDTRPSLGWCVTVKV